MDTNEIKVSEINTTSGFKIGNENAPVKIVEFINVRCPFCRQWYDEKNDFLMSYVNEGKLQRIVKLFDKEKPSLARGNVMHKYIPAIGGDTSLAVLDKIYASQDAWGDLEDHSEIEKYAEETLGLTLSGDTERSATIIAEAQAANVFFIPTMIVGDQVFDQKITTDELAALFNN